MHAHPVNRYVLASFVSLGAALAAAQPYTPASDAEVVERLPGRVADPRLAELARLRAEQRRAPQDAALAVRLARHYFTLAAAEGDPRYVGYAQAALAPWWDERRPPPGVRVQRAVIHQYNHRFAEALADLEAAVAEDPADGEAWAWRAAIHMVQADYAAARRACDGLAPHASALVAAGCGAYVDSMTGRAAAAADTLRAALQADADASAAQRLWALTRLAEIEERLGRQQSAERAYREAIALGITDNYLLAAYADFLLDRGRAGEVLKLLDGRGRADTLLLRLALAARAAGADAAARGYADELGARFDAARLRGDSTHQKEEARYALALQGQPQRALALARENFALQREVADARVLLEAALAARDVQAAQPALQWLSAAGVESVALRSLADRLAALKETRRGS